MLGLWASPDCTSLTIVPCSIREASAFVATHHRHHKAPRGAIFALGVADVDHLVGVAMVGRPVARNLANGWTVEVIRVCVIDHAPKGSCSALYGACWRAARAMGYLRCVTYTLPEEGGASLRGVGWRCIGEAGGGSWSRRERPRVDMHPTQRKLRWEVAA